MEFRRRHQKVDDNFDDLLVFGYPCTIFRDDERATWIENGEHLINSPNDNDLTIDRYDCRLLLTNLKQYEETSSSPYEISAEEQNEKVLLDEERYKDLKDKPAEDDESSKKQQHCAISYSYEPPASTSPSKKEESSSDEENEPFVPATDLKVPPDMIFPHSSTQNFIIEKTAVFVSSQGPQMEIIINAKQKANKRFRFLDYENPLHKYYKHVLKMIREKKYTPSLTPAPRKQKFGSQESEESDEDDGNYLHPSLMASSSKSITSSPSSWPSEPSTYKIGEEHDQYSDLYNRLAVFMPKPAEIKISEEPEICPNEVVEDPKPTVETPCALERSNSPWSSATVVPPPPDLQPIIDRLAEYVARNGADFENIVRSRRDDRFHFLEPSSVYYPYYRSKISWYQYEHYMSNFYHGGAGLADPGVSITPPEPKLNETSSVARKTSKPLIDHPWCTQSVADVGSGNSTQQKTNVDNQPKPFSKTEGVTISFSLKPKEKQDTNIVPKSWEPAEEGGEETAEGLEERKASSSAVSYFEEATVEEKPQEEFIENEYDIFVEEEIQPSAASSESFVKETTPVEELPKEEVEQKFVEPCDLLEKIEPINQLISANNSNTLLQNERRLKARMFLDSLKKTSSEESSRKKHKIEDYNNDDNGEKRIKLDLLNEQGKKHRKQNKHHRSRSKSKS